ncbi:hypothetical protein CJJ07_000404 [Candidozyma auris]|nr:hypothetical protein CJJ07_000404 [[Candida] auris]QEL60947.1 hypothetical protein CJJ09_003081 [[Candida] auris]
MQHGIKREKLSENARKTKQEKDKLKIKHYRRLTARCLDNKHKKIFTKETLAETETLLDLNPEFNAIWNYRRDILVHLFDCGEIKKKDVLEKDLMMVMQMLKRFPKCYWIWNHRYWCLAQLQNDNEANWKFELGIVSKLLELDSRNYHGWHYRRYVIENMENVARARAEGDKGKQVLAELQIDLMDFQYTTEKINKNLSNFSAWHNRANLIPKIFDELEKFHDSEALEQYSEILKIFESPTTLIKHDLDLLKTGIYMDAEDSSIWKYMHWLVSEDLFVKDLEQREEFKAVITQLLKDVEELNALEKEDSANDSDSVWCLKTMVMLKALLLRGNEVSALDEVKAHLERLIELDPLRKGHYKDQLAGEAPLF